MSTVTHEFVLAALTQIDTGHGGSLVAKGWVGDVVTRDGHVLVTLDVPPQLGPTLEPMRDAAEKAVHKLAGVVSATVVMTAGDAGSSAGISPLDRHSTAESCSVPEGDAKLATEPTPIDEFIAAVELVAQNHPDGLSNLAALGYRQNFPGKLIQLSKTLTPVLTDLISRAEKGDAVLAAAKKGQAA